MNIEKEIFKRANVDFKKLKSFGFSIKNGIYHYEETIIDDSFRVLIEAKVFDVDNNEEYYPVYCENSPSSYAREVREVYKNLLIKIRKNCFVDNFFIYPQSKRITEEIFKIFNDRPEFPFEDDDSCGIFRNPESRKWYGLITSLDYSKIDKNKKGEIEIINLKLDKEEINELVKKDGYFRAWHMNKKNWITIILDETLSDKEIMGHIKESHSYTVKKKK